MRDTSARGRGSWLRLPRPVNHALRPAGLLALCALPGLAGVLGCKASAADLSLSKEASDGPVPVVPVPPANGPKLYMLKDVSVLERPATSGRVIGELRAGAAVARSAEPYSKSGCDGGWYVVRPRGFVCAGEAATLVGGAAVALPAQPDLARPMPYRYGRARSESIPVYHRAPSVAEQLANEPDLERHLARTANDDKQLGASANDVPLDPRGVPSGPPVLLPTSEGMDPTGKRTASSFFLSGGSELPPLPLGADAKGVPLRKGSGVAITRTFMLDGGARPRPFGLTPDGRIIPVDRLSPALGTTWTGIDVEKTGLPVAFIHKRGVTTWTLKRGKADKHEDGELERRAAVPLSGKFRTVEGVRFDQTRDGEWLRSQDIVVIVRRSKFPDFVAGTQKWIDVSLANQTLTAYEGRKPIFATLISSGRDQIGDPQTTASTMRGTFKVQRKLVTRAIDTREVYSSYDVADAPWVLEFEQGHAITGNYWSDAMGEAQGYHNVALSPIDARRIWTWSDPQLPEGWHSVVAQEAESTIIHVRN
jgi:hypothetical protein